jgi:queuine tRNA-ribosyltransferase
MVLDECPALPNTRENIQIAVQRSARWAKRFLEVPRLPRQKIFLINQGGTDPELRRESLDLCLKLVESHAADGLAIGGLSVGESHEEMVKTLEFLAPQLPARLPHYLMGVGTPLDILEGIRNGIDMFDCVLPTRNARNGGFFTDSGLLNIRNSQYTDDPRPIEDGCGCECCQNHSRAYLRHLFQTKEIIGLRLATTHNLYYYHRFLKDIRDALEQGRFEALYREKQPLLKEAYPGSSNQEEEVP